MTSSGNSDECTTKSAREKLAEVTTPYSNV